ncbi:FAD-dependent monooxygenase [Streptomyces sp. NBC_00467]|uniref:FAD-dependent monooxygenase n=1 Tax=Streptomyces sp. NBC_00467 TaxID=2975752 RepID=UPI002E177CC8
MTSTNTLSRTAAVQRAVVIGGSMTGMLTAAALRGLAEEVLIVEADELPHGPAPRKGLPQAGHVHLMWSGGVHAAEALLPGLTNAWLMAGAHYVPIPTGMVGLSSQGWFRRWDRESHFLIACSRDLLDSVVRERVVQMSGVRVVQARVEGVLGTAQRVTGVLVRESDGREQVIGADFVVDASGRGSRAPQYLKSLGIDPPDEDVVDAGLVYASRLFRAPKGSDGFPVVSIQADPRAPVPGQSAALLPIEGGKWLVTTGGTRGGEPTGSAEDFEKFARGLRHPLIGEVISHLTPLSGVTLNRSTRNRRRYFERVRRWPEGFVVLGDAVAAFNPVYGHGMSVSAQQALVLRRHACGGLQRPKLAKHVQQAAARKVGAAWSMATGQDLFYPGATGGRLRVANRVLTRYVDRALRTTTGSFSATRKFTDVSSLQSPVASLLAPRLMLATAIGPLRPPLLGPPLSARESALMRPATGFDIDEVDRELP